MKNKRLLIIIAIVIAMLIALIVVLFMQKNNTEQPVNFGEDISGLIDPENQLYNALTKEDFINFQDRLMDYFESKNLPRSSKITIKSVTTPFREPGPVVIIAEIPTISNDDVEIKVDYYADPEATLSIPGQNFTTPLSGGTD